MHHNNAGATEILPLDADLEERTAYDRINHIVYVEKVLHTSPRFQTWLDKCKRRGLRVKVEHALRNEIVHLRQRGMRAPRGSNEANHVDSGNDQQTKRRAYETIDLAACYGASDIHIEAHGTHTTIQFVIDGECRDYTQDGQAEGVALMRAFWNGLAQTKDASWDDLQCQSGQIPDNHLPDNRGLTSGRIIRAPSYPVGQGGCMMTIRLQYHDGALARTAEAHTGLPPLPRPRTPAGRFDAIEAGFTRKQAEKLDLLMSVPYGITMLVGPTGSGKSTLAHKILKERKRRRPGGRIVTIEDPVEIPLDFAVQLPVTDAINDEQRTEKYENLSHASLRMAPNTLFYGEIRSDGVAVAAVQGAQTGHDTWTTMHVSDPFMTVERIEMLDPNRLNRRVICDPEILRGIIAMRLLPELCQHCSKLFDQSDVELSERVVTALKQWGDTSIVRVKGDGCTNCNAGTTGRKMVAEIVVTDDQLMFDFIEKGVAVARVNYRSRDDADPSLLEASILRVLQGTVDPRDVEQEVALIRPPLDYEGRSIEKTCRSSTPMQRTASAFNTREIKNVA